MPKVMHYVLSKPRTDGTRAEISSVDSLQPSLTTRQSITLQYLACWQGREGGSWQAWTWVDRSAAPPWKTPLNALREGEKERDTGGPSLSWLGAWKPKGARWAHAQEKAFSFGVWMYIYQCISVTDSAVSAGPLSRLPELVLWYGAFDISAE